MAVFRIIRSDSAGPGATLIKAGSIKNGKQLTLPVTVNGITGVATLDSGARTTMINNIIDYSARLVWMGPSSCVAKK